MKRGKQQIALTPEQAARMKELRCLRCGHTVADHPNSPGGTPCTYSTPLSPRARALRPLGATTASVCTCPGFACRQADIDAILGAS